MKYQDISDWMQVEEVSKEEFERDVKEDLRRVKGPVGEGLQAQLAAVRDEQETFHGDVYIIGISSDFRDEDDWEIEGYLHMEEGDQLTIYRDEQGEEKIKFTSDQESFMIAREKDSETDRYFIIEAESYDITEDEFDKEDEYEAGKYEQILGKIEEIIPNIRNSRFYIISHT